MRVAARQVSALDGTTKLLLRCADGALSEAVVLFNKNRVSACLSSQSGCACGCAFCATGRLGFARNLTAEEIITQYEQCRLVAPPESIVFMGMGEPLLNWENLKQAILALCDQRGVNFPQSRITVSTVGITPVMRELAHSELKVRLAVSLVTADENERAKLVPVSARYPLGEIIAAARHYCEERKRQVFFEYILLGGLNDSPEDARKLLSLIDGVDCKINLIPYNAAGGGDFAPPSAEKAMEFQKTIMAAGIRAYLRREKGSDIKAACGQLAGAA
ncbi:MAG: 23S rRNA (adenine(2503)-C(2))-methyltransferase RlmN [Elusimicrobiales bacterium]